MPTCPLNRRYLDTSQAAKVLNPVCPTLMPPAPAHRSTGMSTVTIIVHLCISSHPSSPHIQSCPIQPHDVYVYHGLWNPLWPILSKSPAMSHTSWPPVCVLVTAAIQIQESSLLTRPVAACASAESFLVVGLTCHFRREAFLCSSLNRVPT